MPDRRRPRPSPADAAVFEVEPDTFATFREAMQRLERAMGGRLDHDALLLAMARHVLGEPADEGRSSHRIALHVCSALTAASKVAAGELVPIDAALDMAGCDAQQPGEVLTHAIALALVRARPRSSNARRKR